VSDRSRHSQRLVPTEWRDWAEALWAEADEVSGLVRLAWQADGIRLIARSTAGTQGGLGAGVRGRGGVDDLGGLAESGR
jgi:hypothetical protein